MAFRYALVAAIASSGGALLAFLWYSQRCQHKRSNGSRNEKQSEEEGADNNSIVNFHHTAEEMIPSHLRRQLQKEERRRRKVPDLARKSPMYDNIQMFDPDGRLLASISLKKAHWYVRKRLAEWRKTTPDDDDNNDSSIQLTFTPKTHHLGDDDADVQCHKKKANVCVGCGSDEYHIRHYVVPYAYRTLLPTRFKTHQSHDVVILCPDCHLHCEYETSIRMKELENERPLECQRPSHVDRYLHGIRSAAIALLRWKHKLPPSKVEEYEHLIRCYLHMESNNGDLSEQQLQEAIDVEYRIPNPSYVSGPDYVVGSLDSDDRIERFIRDWRQHFLDTVQPRFLSDGWSVSTPVTNCR